MLTASLATVLALADLAPRLSPGQGRTKRHAALKCRSYEFV